jgi:hypothetical protein
MPRTARFLPAASSLIAPLTQSRAVVANSSQGHRLVAGGTQSAGPAVLPIVATTVTRSTPSPDTGLAGTQGLHLFFSGQLRGAQDRAVSPFEVAAIRVMPQPGLGSCGRAINVHRINHVPNVWMFHSGRHGSTLLGWDISEVPAQQLACRTRSRQSHNARSRCPGPSGPPTGRSARAVRNHGRAAPGREGRGSCGSQANA